MGINFGNGVLYGHPVAVCRHGTSRKFYDSACLGWFSDDAWGAQSNGGKKKCENNDIG